MFALIWLFHLVLCGYWFCGVHKIRCVPVEAIYHPKGRIKDNFILFEIKAITSIIPSLICPLLGETMILSSLSNASLPYYEYHVAQKRLLLDIADHSHDPHYILSIHCNYLPYVQQCELDLTPITGANYYIGFTLHYILFNFVSMIVSLLYVMTFIIIPGVFFVKFTWDLIWKQE